MQLLLYVFHKCVERYSTRE